MLHMYVKGKRIASVSTWAMAYSIAELTNLPKITVKEKSKVRGVFRYGHWEGRA